jgi:hypothetical protein
LFQTNPNDITSDEFLPCNTIYELMAQELGVSLNAIHIPSDFIASIDDSMYGSLLGDKSHSMIFDNTKIKKFVPEFNATVKFEDGV